MSRHEPALIVSVMPAGQQNPVRVDVTDRVIAFEYEDVDDKADMVRISLDNFDLTDLDDPIWSKGNLLECSWGYAGSMAPSRLLQIRKVSGFQRFKIEAHGLEVALNTIERTRTFENMTRSDVAKQIANSWGYTETQHLHIEDTSVVREVITQSRLTDAQMLRRLAAREGFEWFIDFDGFHFHRRTFGQRPLRALEWKGGEYEIIDIDIDQDVSGKRNKVSARGRDPLTRTTIVEEANQQSEAAERDVVGNVQEVPDSPLYNVATEAVIPTTERSTESVKRVASSKFRTSQQHAVQVDVTMVGDPNLLAKSIVELKGIGKRFSGRYYVKEVKHEISGSGYMCKVKLLSDGSGGHSTKSVRAREANAINVAPKVQGRKGPSAPKRDVGGIDLPPELRTRLDGVDADGAPRSTFADGRNREPPPSK